MLSRASLVCPAMAWKMKKEEFVTRFIRFVKNLPELVVLFGVLKFPEDALQKLNNDLRQMFRKERPAFCVDLQPTIAAHSRKTRYDSEVLPAMHNDLLTDIESKVAILPFGRDSMLDRLN